MWQKKVLIGENSKVSTSIMYLKVQRQQDKEKKGRKKRNLKKT